MIVPAVRDVTASMLYDLVSCDHRVALDVHGDASARDRVSPFVAMLWRAGAMHEDAMVAGLDVPFVDLRAEDPARVEASTAAAMAARAPLIVGGAIRSGDMSGRPDLLVWERDAYVAGDVKSGAAEETMSTGARRPKLTYGVQLAHYALILAETRAGAGDRAFVVGREGDRVDYDLLTPWSGASLRERHAAALEAARLILSSLDVDGAGTRPALSATCKLCHWRAACKADLVARADLTLVPQLGRALGNAMRPHVGDLRELARVDVTAMTIAGGRTVVSGLGAARLSRFRDRALLLTTDGAEPYARRPLGLSRSDRELHFDIEADPLRDIVYLHGVVERVRTRDGDVSTFVPFFADGCGGGHAAELSAEREAFAAAFAYLAADPSASIYYWSKYERTAYRALQTRHPSVCSPAEIEALFDPARAVDLLFDVVVPHTEWPTYDQSIKSIARFCGFAWRDVDAGGAASIEWYDRWARTREPGLKERILAYNHDDCLATAVVLDALIELPVR